jgi:hypothetical protein
MSNSKLAKLESKSQNAKINTKRIVHDLVPNTQRLVMQFLNSYERATLLETCVHFRDLGYQPGSSSPVLTVDVYWLLHGSNVKRENESLSFSVPRSMMDGKCAPHVQELILRLVKPFPTRQSLQHRKLKWFFCLFPFSDAFCQGMDSLCDAFSLPILFPNLKKLTISAEGTDNSRRFRPPGAGDFFGVRKDTGRVLIPKLESLTLIGDYVWLSDSMKLFLQPSITSFSVQSTGQIFALHPMSGTSLASLLPNLTGLSLSADCDDVKLDRQRIRTNEMRCSLLATFPKLLHLHLSRISIVNRPMHQLSFDGVPFASSLQTFRFFDGHIGDICGLRSLTNLRELSLFFGVCNKEEKEQIAHSIGIDIPHLHKLQTLRLGHLDATNFVPHFFVAAKTRGGPILPDLHNLILFNCPKTADVLNSIPFGEIFHHVQTLQLPVHEYAELKDDVKRDIETRCKVQYTV